jgi:hypothetical protein
MKQCHVCLNLFDESQPHACPGTPHVSATLQQRGGTHGKFTDNAAIAQDLRTRMRAAPNWDKQHPAQQLALDEIALKIARILSDGADPAFAEHWHDIQGYAKLGEQACSKTS